MDTKEQILLTALELFARKGYDAVSVSMMAGQLGMSKSARDKQDLFEQLLARRELLDARFAAQWALPTGTASQMPEAYQAATSLNLRAFTLALLQRHMDRFFDTLEEP